MREPGKHGTAPYSEYTRLSDAIMIIMMQLAGPAIRNLTHDADLDSWHFLNCTTATLFRVAGMKLASRSSAFPGLK
jgi:hypothetical protein